MFFVTFVRRSLTFLLFYQKHGPRPGKTHCVFIKCFRAKRILFWTRRLRATAEPFSDDPDNSEDDEIQVAQVAEASKVGSLLV